MPNSILPVTARPETVLLPPIGTQTLLTLEQRTALWGRGCVGIVLRDCQIAAMQEALLSHSHVDPTTISARVRDEGAVNA